MEFKIVERFYPVTLTKPSQLCKAKHKNKINKFFPSRQLHVQS